MPLNEYILSIIFPRVCSGCGNLLFKNEELICTSCLYKLPRTDWHVIRDNPVKELFWGRVNIELASSFLLFVKDGRVQRMIHEFKYRGKKEIGVLLGELYGNDLIKVEAYRKIDTIIPVPLHWSKQKKRGFNQSQLFANGLSKSMGIKTDSRTLFRKTATETQTKKSRFKRWENVHEVFAIDGGDRIMGKHVLLVDDVITTGSTLEASATVLMSVPGVKVSIATIAVANQ